MPRAAGISYGTHLAAATLRAYPDVVARAVLAGVEGPDDTLKLPAHLDDHLRRVAGVIAADPSAHELVPDLLAAFDTIKKRLEASVTVQVQAGTLVMAMVADCASGASPARLERIAKEAAASRMGQSSAVTALTQD